jgi:hypothetical protein
MKLHLERNDRKVLTASALVLWAAGAVAAQAGHITPFTGVWELNVAKSSFDPGPPFQRFTLTFTPDGTRKLDLTYANGQTLELTLPWSDGKEVSVKANQGFENVTTVSKIRGKTFQDTWWKNGKIIEKVHAAVSPDGRTLKIGVDGTGTQGRAFHNRLTFERR